MVFQCITVSITTFFHNLANLIQQSFYLVDRENYYVNLFLLKCIVLFQPSDLKAQKRFQLYPLIVGKILGFFLQRNSYTVTTILLDMKIVGRWSLNMWNPFSTIGSITVSPAMKRFMMSRFNTLQARMNTF